MYIYICMYISAPLKGGRRHQGVSPFYKELTIRQEIAEPDLLGDEAIQPCSTWTWTDPGTSWRRTFDLQVVGKFGMLSQWFRYHNSNLYFSPGILVWWSRHCTYSWGGFWGCDVEEVRFHDRQAVLESQCQQCLQRSSQHHCQLHPKPEKRSSHRPGESEHEDGNRMHPWRSRSSSMAENSKFS
jgi:hypothetical protein